MNALGQAQARYKTSPALTVSVWYVLSVLHQSCLLAVHSVERLPAKLVVALPKSALVVLADVVVVVH